MAKTPLTNRQKRVIRTGAANVADVYNLKPKGEARFRRSATRAIRKSGTSDISRAYRQTIVKAAKVTTTKKEAAGAKRVLRRADRRTSSSTRNVPKRRTASKRSY